MGVVESDGDGGGGWSVEGMGVGGGVWRGLVVDGGDGGWHLSIVCICSRFYFCSWVWVLHVGYWLRGTVRC